MNKIMIIGILTMWSATCFSSNYELHPGQPDFRCNRFDIDLKYNCEEGEMACQDVDYDGINKNTGARLKLKGRVMFNSHSYDFQGYIFDNGQYSYTLNPDYSKEGNAHEIWVLNIFYKNKILSHDECLAN